MSTADAPQDPADRAFHDWVIARRMYPFGSVYQEAFDAGIEYATGRTFRNVDRFEVIDHRASTGNMGRVLVTYNIECELLIQDQERTLKVVLKDRP